MIGGRVVFLLCAYFCTAALSAHAAFQEFSADVVLTGAAGRATAKAYIAKDMVRMELPGGVVITRLDKDRSWLFVPQERAYVEQPIDKKVVISVSGAVDGEVARSAVGREEAAGVSAVKYRVVYREGAHEKVVYQWIAEGTGIPVKTAADDGSWSIEYLHCKPGALEAALFEIPEGRQECVPPEEGGGIPLSWGDQEGQVY